MAAAPPPMELVNDIHFLRQDNANLLKEVMSLRQQSTLLRDRSGELERKLRDCLASGAAPQTHLATYKTTQRHSTVLDLTAARSYPPKLKLDIPDTHDTQKRDLEEEGAELAAVWFDDTTAEQEPAKEHPAEPLALGVVHFAASGSQLIGEAPRATPEQRVEEQSINRPSTITPPSPDPSERQSRITLPSLLSVKAPVQGVAVPNVAASLLELRLIRKEAYDTPAAVASFLQKLTQTTHTPQSTYRAAFTAAFLALIPLLGPPGTLSVDWLSFLHDFPSRIPHTQRDSVVSIPWPESYISQHGVDPGFREPPRPPRSSNTYSPRRRSRSLDGILRRPSPIPGNRLPDLPRATDLQTQTLPTGVPTGERDAWVLLLALAYAAFPASRVAAKLRKLPVTVKLQMIAWLPPGVNVYANLHFSSTTVDEALGQFWDAKKEILRLKHGWP
ncbi:hypothetical protein JB92DRAFT_3145184 [Gautieria morchelliformis]|nr:hypothetical protein JB92DRAFT_3145184 [Gautieria morchelliformis]